MALHRSRLQKLLCGVAAVLMFAVAPCSHAQDQNEKPFSEFIKNKPVERTEQDDYHLQVLEKSLEGEGEPGVEEWIETTIFDLYLSDRLVGSVVTEYTDNWFKISNPDDAVEQYTSLKNPGEMRKLFEGRVPKRRDIDGLGGVFYELDTFRIILEPEADQLFAVDVSSGGRLPDPEDKFALNQRLRGAVSAEKGKDKNLAVNHRTLTSYGSIWGKLNGTGVKDEDYELTEASLSAIKWGMQHTGGFLETPGTLFANSADVVGFGMTTSEDILLDQDLLRGSKLEIFVPSRARVDFFRGDRILNSQILDFGLQEVDTSGFPEGSYSVDIVIREDSGAEIRERRFFTKSGLLSIRSKPILSFQAGYLRDQLDVFSDVPLFQAGVRARVLGPLQMSASMYGSEDFTIGSLGAVAVYRDIFMETSFASDDNGNLGYRTALSGYLGDLNLTVNFQETTGDEDVEFDEEEESDILFPPLEPFPTPTPVQEADKERLKNSINTLTEKTSSISGNISWFIGRVRAVFSGNRTKNGGRDARYAYGPSLEWTINNDAKRSWKLYAAVLDTDAGERIEARLNYRYSFDLYALDGQLSNRSDADDQDTSLRTSMTIDRKRLNDLGLRTRLTNEMRAKTGDSSENSMVNSIDANYANRFSRARGVVRDRRADDKESTTLSGDFESAFNMTAEGISVNRPANQESILLVGIKSETTKSPIEILVNNQPRELIVPGEQAVIGLPPFKSYRVSIRPTEDADLVAYDTNSVAVTLFPGNIMRKTWSVDKVFIAIGRLIDQHGLPMEWRRIRGLTEYVVTENDGFFQAEITGRDELFVESGGKRCVLKFPDIERGEFFTSFGDVPCLP